MTKKAKTKAAPKKPKSRTSIWLDDDLRAQLDRRVESTSLSLARVISDTLRKGLARSGKDAPDAPATIFG